MHASACHGDAARHNDSEQSNWWDVFGHMDASLVDGGQIESPVARALFFIVAPLAVLLLLTMSAVYRRKPTFGFAVVSALVGVAAVVAVMSCLNMAITPLVVHDVTYQDVTSLVPSAVAPFNLGKASVNAAITVACYRPLGRLLAG